MTTTAERPAPAAAETPRSRREVLEALSGLLLAMFVSILTASANTTFIPSNSASPSNPISTPLKWPTPPNPWP